MINVIVSNDLPDTVSAFIRENEDDSYTILINAHLSYEKQRQGYLHELEHLQDFDTWSAADEIERIRHEGI